jgi:hypothetical protein
MNDNKKPRALIVAIGVFSTVLLLAGYIVGYVARSEAGSGPDDLSRLRIFSTRSEAYLFWPAMYVEGMALGCPVYVVYESEVRLVYRPNAVRK